jgi:predicted anti-sigma-YlaC factor YlaD
MDCTLARTALSAQLDGEDPGLPAGALDAHLAACGACWSWHAQASALHSRVRVAPAPAVPDLSGAVLAAIGTEPVPRPGRRAPGRTDVVGAAPGDRGLRLALAVVALVQIGVALPALLLGEDAGLPVHTARHLGSFAVALGVGFLVAAWRPSRIAGLLPFAAALVACLVVTSALDVAAGRAAPTGELTHVTELVGLAALWLLARAERPRVLTIRPA